MTATLAQAAAFWREGDFPNAARACAAILASDPTHFDALHLLGVVCTNLGQAADGLAFLLRAAATGTDSAQLRSNLGVAYATLRRFDEATESYRRALEIGPRSAGALNNLGLALLERDDRDEAADMFQAALALDPAFHAAHYNLAKAWAASGRLAEAETISRGLLERLPPDTPAERASDIANEHARYLMEQGRPEEALAALRALVRARPDVAPMAWNESLALLVLGRLPEGWAAYEARWRAPNHDPPHPSYSVLDVDRVAGRRVFVTEEQGRGDIVQCLRFLSRLTGRGARVFLRVYDDLVALAREIPAVEQVLGPEEDEPDHDLRTSIMSLPLAFRTDLETIPAEVPYLRVPASRAAAMRHRLGEPRGPRVGLVWSGSAASAARSAMPVSLFAPLLARPGVAFHGLQKDVSPADRAWLEQSGSVTMHDAALHDFADTAALIEAMDLTISIDTAVAHLAGALGRPVWILLPFAPDWRWLLGRDDSPWYPTARLFRQAAAGDWEGVVRAVAEALPFYTSARLR